MKKIFLSLMVSACSSQYVLRSAEVSGDTALYAKQKAIGDIPIIYGWDLDRNNDGAWDGPAQFDAWADANSLSSLFTGHLVLDVEGVIETNLVAGVPSGEREMLKILNYAKNKFPLARIGFYGVPRITYYGDNGYPWLGSPLTRFRNEEKAYANIQSQVTAYYPSLYQFYPNNYYPETRDYNLNYIKWNLKNILSQKGTRNVPVLVFTMPGLHECCMPTTQPPGRLIERAEFIEQLKLILATEESGKRVDGLIWWDALKHARRVLPSTDPLFIEMCGKDATTWDACVDQLHRRFVDDYSSSLK